MVSVASQVIGALKRAGYKDVSLIVVRESSDSTYLLFAAQPPAAPDTPWLERMLGQLFSAEVGGQRRITQEGLAEMAGLHRTYVCLLERGEKYPSLPVVFILVGKLGVKPSELIASTEVLVTVRPDAAPDPQAIPRDRLGRTRRPR
jgi:DNA-binding XRE family transcriptional regulator